jgi:hypothetical protein
MCSQRGVVVSASVLTVLLFAGTSQANLLHRWSFNGNTNDSVGGATATLFFGATVSGSELDLTPNVKDPPSYADLPVQASLQANISNEITYEFWYQVDQLTPYNRLFMSGDIYTDAFQFIPHISTAGVAEYWSDTAPGHGILDVNAGAVTVNTPTHVAVTYKDNDKFSVFVNGALANSTSTVGKASASHTTFAKNLLGANWVGGLAPGASAKIDEFRIYNHALPASSVAAHFANGPDGAVVPEPATAVIALVALIGLSQSVRRRRRK